MLGHFEGTRLAIYADQAGVPTIGTGHALTAAERASGVFAGGITAEQARGLLRADVDAAEHAVNTLVKVTLSQHQFDVLVSFTFNVGGGALAGSTLLERLNAGNYGAVPVELPKWCKRKDPLTGQLVPDVGLLGRRKAEAVTWENGYGHPGTDSAIADAAKNAFARQFSTAELLGDSAFTRGGELPEPDPAA